MSIDPSQVSVNLGSVYEWLKLLGYLGLGVTAIWKLSRFATKSQGMAHEFVVDIRKFLNESRIFMTRLEKFTAVVETNHLKHIEEAVADIRKSLAEAPLARVVKEDQEEPK